MIYWIALGGLVSVIGLVVSIFAIIKAGEANKIAKGAHEYTVNLDKEQKEKYKNAFLKTIGNLIEVIGSYTEIIKNTSFLHGSLHRHLIEQVKNTINVLQDDNSKAKLQEATRVFCVKVCAGSELEIRSKKAIENLDTLRKEAEPD